MPLYLSLTENPCEGFQLRSDSILFENSEARRRLGGDLKARPLAFLDLILVEIKSLVMTSSSRRSTRAAVAADAAAATTAVDRARGLARSSRQSRPVVGVIAPSSTHLGVCHCSSRIPLACMCLFGYVVFDWGLLRRSLLQGFSSPGPITEACRGDSPSLGFSSPNFKYCSLLRRSSSRGFSSPSFEYYGWDIASGYMRMMTWLQWFSQP